MTDFVPNRLSSRSLIYQFSPRGMARQLADYLPSASFFLTKNKALGIVLAWSFTLFLVGGGQIARAETLTQVETRLSLNTLEKKFSLTASSGDLCAWERDLGFFLSASKEDKSERIDCTSRLKQEDVGVMKKEFQPASDVLVDELDSMVEGFPIAAMTKAIAQYDREIAGLIVGIGKKESNWGKRTPKLEGVECFNFWGYRGAGTNGFTPDGYGCWNTPEEAVKTIGDRLVKLREVRLSAEPARMVVWKCGSTCAGHSDESVRKWIADVSIYYREIAQK